MPRACSAASPILRGPLSMIRAGSHIPTPGRRSESIAAISRTEIKCPEISVMPSRWGGALGIAVGAAAVQRRRQRIAARQNTACR